MNHILPNSANPQQAVEQTKANSTIAQGKNIKADQPNSELRERFDEFVGQTLFGQMLKSMRKTQEKPAYFHGGRGEEVFQSEMDQLLVKEITKASAKEITEPMFEQFTGRNQKDYQSNADGKENVNQQNSLSWRQQALLQSVDKHVSEPETNLIDFVA